MPCCLLLIAMNRLPDGDSLTVSSSVSFSAMSQPKKYPAPPRRRSGLKASTPRGIEALAVGDTDMSGGFRFGYLETLNIDRSEHLWSEKPQIHQASIWYSVNSPLRHGLVCNITNPSGGFRSSKKVNYIAVCVIFLHSRIKALFNYLCQSVFNWCEIGY